ncbi:MAG: DUF2971 domain-containing protein [Lachnospiraceae bacterium]
MDVHDEFFELLLHTMISSTDDAVQARDKLVRLRDWLLSNVPSKLYRFRSPSEHSFDALVSDQIWGSRIDTFNDPFENEPCYDWDTLSKWLDTEFYCPAGSALERLKQAQQGSVPEDVLRWMQQGGADNAIGMLKGIDPDDSAIVYYFRLFQLAILKQVPGLIPGLPEAFFKNVLWARQQRYAACFSEEFKATLMWAHYAKSHEGFCIEYDFKRYMKGCEENCGNILGCHNFMLNLTLAPVHYSGSRFDATNYLKTIFQHELGTRLNVPLPPYHADVLFMTKALLVKSEDWSYEKEWRLISPPENESKEEPPRSKLLTRTPPTAVYIGARASSETEEKLEYICSLKNIPCYKMVQAHITSKFDLEPVPYFEFKRYIQQNQQ